MRQLKILHTREIKGILEAVNKQWGCDLKKIFSEFVVLLSSKDKIYLLSRDFAKLDDRKLRIDSAGMYFGEMLDNKAMRLSIEGSQIVGLHARNNVVELDEDEARAWLLGKDIEKEADAEGFVLLKSRNKETRKYDFLGCGKYKGKERKILNYVPKARRVSGS